MRPILVTFDLVGGDANDYLKAHQVLYGLGLSVLQKNIQLPDTTVMGVWYADGSVESIRGILINMLLEAGVPLNALAVVVYSEAAWWRKTP